MPKPALSVLHMLARTPFYDFHVSAGAKLVDFAGWEMPLMYRTITDEHVQTRTSGSLFDVSHMGRLTFAGTGAKAFLDRVLTRKIEDQRVGQSRYSLACNERGGVLDDVIISRDARHWFMVCNASNREKLLAHFEAVKAAGNFDVAITDLTATTAMVALQGPKIIEKLGNILPVDLKELPRYSFEHANLLVVKLTVYRCGYTGEDGVEVVLPASAAAMAMKMIGGSLDKDGGSIRPAGLGARDTLRTEAGMPLYGHELSEETDPLSARLHWAVDLTKDFIGAPALKALADGGLKRKLVGLALEGKRIARQGTPIKSANGGDIGVVTSGTLSPTLGTSIAMGYVDVASTAVGTTLQVDLKGTLIPATVVKLPFYKRTE